MKDFKHNRVRKEFDLMYKQLNSFGRLFLHPREEEIKEKKIQESAQLVTRIIYTPRYP